MGINENWMLWKYVKTLRKFEYYKNNHSRILSRLYRIKHERQVFKTGIMIGANSVDVGLSIAHVGSVIINGNAKIGKNFRVHVGVLIGASKGAAPTIGDDVYFGPGAKCYGNVYVADGCRVGANAVVNKSCSIPKSLLVGVPAETKKCF